MASKKRALPKRSDKSIRDMSSISKDQILNHLDIKSLGRLATTSSTMRRKAHPHLRRKLIESQKETYKALQKHYKSEIIGQTIDEYGIRDPLIDPKMKPYPMPGIELMDGTEFGINPIQAAKFAFKQEQKIGWSGYRGTFDSPLEKWKRQGYLSVAKERISRKLHTLMAHPYNPGIESTLPKQDTLGITYRDPALVSPEQSEEEDEITTDDEADELAANTWP